MENLKKIISKTFAAIAIIGVYVAVCTMDGSNHEVAMRIGGVAAFIIGVVGWSLTGKEETVL